MPHLSITYSDSRDITLAPVIDLYKANGWSSADKPSQLHQGLLNSHSLWTAWDGDRLIGLGSAISDGRLLPPPAGPPGLSRQGNRVGVDGKAYVEVQGLPPAYGGSGWKGDRLLQEVRLPEGREDRIDVDLCGG